MITRIEALNLIKSKISKKNWIYHILAVESILKGLATHFHEDEEKWGLLGLLHDIDFSDTENKPERHGLEAEIILSGKVSDDIIRAIKAHNYTYSNIIPQSKMEKALIASDAISGLIIASALVMPSKKIEDVTIKTLEKKYKKKDFAKGADRDRIQLYEKLNLTRDEFFEIALNSMKKISNNIGL